MNDNSDDDDCEDGSLGIMGVIGRFGSIARTHDLPIRPWLPFTNSVARTRFDPSQWRRRPVPSPNRDLRPQRQHLRSFRGFFCLITLPISIRLVQNHSFIHCSCTVFWRLQNPNASNQRRTCVYR